MIKICRYFDINFIYLIAIQRSFFLAHPQIFRSYFKGFILTKYNNKAKFVF